MERRNALITEEALYSLAERETLPKFAERYDKVFVQYPLRVNESLNHQLAQLQSEGKIVIVYFGDALEIKKDYMRAVDDAVQSGHLEAPSPAEYFMETELAPLLAWSARLNADIVFPERSPYTELREELEKESEPAHA